MRPLLLILFLSLLVPSGSFALTMDQAVQRALAHNPKIKQFVDLEKSSTAKAKQAEAPFWPSLQASYLYTDANDKNGYATYDQSNITASARYNLFNGGSDWFRKSEGDFRSSAAGDMLKSTVADVILEVRRDFINHLRTKRNLATEQQSVELLERQNKTVSCDCARDLLPATTCCESKSNWPLRSNVY